VAQERGEQKELKMNPIALTVIALGVLLFLIGLVLFAKHIKVTGIALALLGVSLAACPLALSFYLGPNP
jgi:hypothetical protein